MGQKIVKTFGKKTQFEIESGGVTSFVSYDRLREYISIAIGIKPNETIEGIIVDETGITARIGPKKND